MALATSTCGFAYDLESKSHFSQKNFERNPFIPLNHSAGVQDNKQKKFSIKKSDFKISSIMGGNPPIAVINGKIYSQGEVYRYDTGGITIPFTVVKITSTSVTFAFKEKRFTVKIKRQVSVNKKIAPTE